MGDMNNNTNDGNELDNTPFTPDNQDTPNTYSEDSGNPGYENPTEQTQFNESFYKDDSNETTYGQSYQSYATEPEQSPGKKSKFGVIAAVIVILALLSGSVYAFANWNTFANSFALMTKSPIKYYAGIEQKALNKGIDSLTESYGKYIDLYNKQKESGMAQDTNVKLTVNSQFTGLIGLNDFQSLEAKISSLSKGNKGKASIGISYNAQPLVTLNTLMDSETGDIYTSIPELSSAYLLFSLNEIMAYSGDDYSNYAAEMETLLANETLSPDVLNALLKKYSAIVVNNIDNMTLDKNIKLTASDISGTYNVLTSELNGEDITKIAAAILSEAKNDDQLKNLFVTLQVCTADEYASLIDDALTEINSTKEAYLDTSDSVFMRVYVDKAGRIIGREFTSSIADSSKDSSGDANATSGGYYLVNKGNKVGIKGWMKEDGQNILDFSAGGSVSAKGFTGDSVLSFSEYNYEYDDYTTYSFNVAAENAKMTTDKGYVNGKFTVTSDLLMGASIVLDCKSEDKSQNVKLQLLYGGIDAGAIEITSTEGTYQDFELPSDTDQVYDGITDIYSYMGTADFEGLFSKVEEATGLDLSSLLSSLLFNSSY